MNTKQSEVKHNTFSQGNVKSINNIIGPKNVPPNYKQQNTVQHSLIPKVKKKGKKKFWIETNHLAIWNQPKVIKFNIGHYILL